jgi:hypothetical protein
VLCTASFVRMTVNDGFENALKEVIVSYFTSPSSQELRTDMSVSLIQLNT